MTVVTAPNKLPTGSVFLAGGISNCPDWQSEAIAVIERSAPEIIILNPRRAVFDVADKSASEKQVKWEHDALLYAESVLFWFPKEALCPIALFELGKIAFGTQKALFVGCHPEYVRKMDVVEQLKHIRPGLIVYEDLNRLLSSILLNHTRKNKHADLRVKSPAGY